ncbi:hypothetical protein V491_03764, partial [Pseudogymnoascus sp. VKM F-3775]
MSATQESQKKTFGKSTREIPHHSQKASKWYPAEDEAQHKKVRKTIRASTPRSSLVPGTVLILLAGRFRGKRVILLNTLDQGVLLVTGPFKVNGVPIRRVNARYVIATSHKVDISGVDSKKIEEISDEKYFAREASDKKTGEAEFFKQGEKPEKKKPSSNRAADQKSVDKSILSAIKKEPFLVSYLASSFSLRKGDRPHEMACLLLQLQVFPTITVEPDHIPQTQKGEENSAPSYYGFQNLSQQDGINASCVQSEGLRYECARKRCSHRIAILSRERDELSSGTIGSNTSKPTGRRKLDAQNYIRSKGSQGRMTAKAPPQAFISSYAPRLRTYANSLLTPVIQPAAAIATPSSRTTKRGTTAINYAEDGFEDYDEDDDEGRRRPTGLRSLRREETLQAKQDVADKFGKEATEPVEVQGVWREWMGKARSGKPDLQAHSQASLPLTLVPIRIDVDIPAFIPQPPLPLPSGAAYNNIDPSLPVYRTPEVTVPYRLKDIFLWNLHETLTTTDQFAQCMVQDLDLPNRQALAMEISKQIRTQLEEYAGVALHPLFHSQQTPAANGTAIKTIQASTASRDHSATPAMSGRGTPLHAPHLSTNGFSTPVKAVAQEVTATALPIPQDADDYNPDDTYRCIITLNINLSNNLYTDKFEWSLLHPPGTAEIFAKQTCADMGLSGEWVPAMTHAIYEAVLRLKKEACESGGLVGGYGGEIPNEAVHGSEAGWRYDNEQLADEWEPKVEVLSKEEIEKREGDRERQIRRMRRETARFSSNTGMLGGMPQSGGPGFFDQGEPTEERMGRGERSKKKRRFRSLSPLGRSG